MKNLLLGLFVLFSLTRLSAQIVTTDPTIPVESQPVKIIFDATLGTAGLQGFAGDVYAHTGVITDKSTSGSDWKYVKTNWGENTPETKLTRVGADLYELQITPNIRQYYGVPGNEEILQMAFVFRSADTSLEGKDDGGKDIFVEVFQEGFIVKIDRPDDNTLIDPGQTISLEVSSTQEADIELLLNDEAISETSGTSLSFDYTFEDPGNYWIVARANNSSEQAADTVYVCVKEEITMAVVPYGFRKGINYPDETSAALVLWAPEKDYVFVLGDFNDWRPRNEYQMKKSGDYFWIEIPDLSPGQPYVFQYLIDGELLLADPYTDQVSDPFNDKYIPESVYPGLVDYPILHTNGMASVLTTGQVPYAWEVTDFEPADKEELVIYELLIRDFDERHSYQAVIERLDYLETLGVNALQLMPVNEFEGNSSWGYNPSFYFAPDKYYGPKNDLKKLIDECHKRGIAVILDMVLNHSYSQSPLVQMYFKNGKPASNNPWYNVNHNFTNVDALWGYDFDHESIHTQELVDSINSYWMTEYKVDGFRFDFTKGFGNNIKGSSDPWGSLYDADRVRLLKRMADEVWERNPNALVIFEHLAENSEEKVLAQHGIFLWANMQYDYKEAAMGYNSNLNWGIYKNRGWSEPQLVTYMESHDEERIMHEIFKYGNSSGDYDTRNPIIAAHRIGLNSLFFLPLPGPKMIWQFGELGYDVSINYDCRVCEKPILWEYYDEWQRKNIYDIMSNLNFLKTTYDIFSTDDFVVWLSGDVKQYRLTHDGEFVVAVGNFDVDARSTTVNLPKGGTWYEYFERSSIDVTDLSMSLTLEPGEYKLFSTQEFDWKVDMSPVNTDEINAKNISFSTLDVFPLPSNDRINWRVDLTTVQLFDLKGNLMNNQTAGHSMDISNLPGGMYVLLGVDNKGNLYSSRVIRE